VNAQEAENVVKIVYYINRKYQQLESTNTSTFRNLYEKLLLKILEGCVLVKLSAVI